MAKSKKQMGFVITPYVRADNKGLICYHLEFDGIAVNVAPDVVEQFEGESKDDVLTYVCDCVRKSNPKHKLHLHHLKWKEKEYSFAVILDRGKVTVALPNRIGAAAAMEQLVEQSEMPPKK